MSPNIVCKYMLCILYDVFSEINYYYYYRVVRCQKAHSNTWNNSRASGWLARYTKAWCGRRGMSADVLVVSIKYTVMCSACSVPMNPPAWQKPIRCDKCSMKQKIQRIRRLLTGKATFLDSHNNELDLNLTDKCMREFVATLDETHTTEDIEDLLLFAKSVDVSYASLIYSLCSKLGSICNMFELMYPCLNNCQIN